MKKIVKFGLLIILGVLSLYVSYSFDSYPVGENYEFVIESDKDGNLSAENVLFSIDYSNNFFDRIFNKNKANVKISSVLTVENKTNVIIFKRPENLEFIDKNIEGLEEDKDYSFREGGTDIFIDEFDSEKIKDIKVDLEFEGEISPNSNFMFKTGLGKSIRFVLGDYRCLSSCLINEDYSILSERGSQVISIESEDINVMPNVKNKFIEFLETIFVALGVAFVTASVIVLVQRKK